MSIPAGIDHLMLLADLKRWGWQDNKIELACDFSSGYVSQLKCGNIKDMSYSKAARLFNFWESELDLYSRRQASAQASSA